MILFFKSTSFKSVGEFAIICTLLSAAGMATVSPNGLECFRSLFAFDEADFKADDPKYFFAVSFGQTSYQKGKGDKERKFKQKA